MTLGAISFLSGLGQGYLNGRMRADDDERRKKREARMEADDAYREELRGRQRAEWAKSDKLDADLTAASAPVVPQSAEVYQPQSDDEGNAMPANPTLGTYAAGGRKFGELASAETAARGMNTPSAVARRQAGVYQGAGKLKEAVDHNSTADMLEKEGYLKFIDANLAVLPGADKLKAGPMDFALTGIDQFNAQGANQLPPDAKGRAKLVTLPSGEQVVDFDVVMPDGRVSPTSARQMADFYGKTRAEREAGARQQFKDGQDRSDKDRDYALREADQKLRGRREERMAVAAERAATAAEAKAAAVAERAGETGQVPLKDMRDFEHDVNKRLEALYDPKSAADPAEAPAIAAKRNQVATQANGIFEANATRGRPVTADTALRAIDLAKDPKQVRRMQANTGEVFEVVMVNGNAVIVSPPLQKAPPQPAGPAAPVQQAAPAPTASQPLNQMQGMSMNDLARIAASPGHTSQQAAAAEIQRRRAAGQSALPANDPSNMAAGA